MFEIALSQWQCEANAVPWPHEYGKRDFKSLVEIENSFDVYIVQCYYLFVLLESQQSFLSFFLSFFFFLFVCFSTLFDFLKCEELSIQNGLNIGDLSTPFGSIGQWLSDSPPTRKCESKFFLKQRNFVLLCIVRLIWKHFACLWG